MHKLFQYAIFWTPNQEQVKNGEKPKMLVAVKTVIAATDSNAHTLASRDIPVEYLDQLDQVTIAVRPF